MSEKITIRVNDSLSRIFKTDDPIYKAVICDKDGSLDPAIDSPIRTLSDALLYYPLVSDTLDISGNGYNGVATDITWEGGVANFNGVSSKIIFNNPIVNRFTISFKIKFNTITRTQGIVFQNSINSLGIRISSAGYIIIYTSFDGLTIIDIGNSVSSMSIDTQYTFILSFDGAKYDFTINGVLQTSYISIQQSVQSSLFRLGCWNWDDPNLFFDGTISNFYIFNRALTDAERTWLYEDSGTNIRWIDPYGTKPSDYNLGAVTNNIEYLRQLGIGLLKQLYINQASGEFLKYILETFFGSLRLEGETESDWIMRTVSLIFQPRVSRASIIYALRSYSSQEPEIISAGSDSMFADVSFADVGVNITSSWEGTSFYIFPALAQSDESSYYSIIITLYDTPANQLYAVADIINKFIAAGISFTISIIYT